MTQSPKLTSLPAVLLSDIVTRLSVEDIFHLCTAIPVFKKHAVPVVTQVLLDEELPGETLADLMDHFRKLQEYRKKIVKAIYEVAPGASVDDMESEEGKQAVSEFLTKAIENFTRRVAGAHSWYKNLPIGLGKKFEFCLDLMVNWRMNKGKWEKKVEGDGTRFHYTWLPTEEYNQRYGFFNYRCTSYELKRMLLKDDQCGDIYIPMSTLGPAVDVTAALHDGSLRRGFYLPIVKAVVEAGCPMLVYEELQPSMFVGMQNRFRGSKQMRLPNKAAAALEIVARRALKNETEGGNPDHSSDHGTRDDVSDTNTYHDLTNEAFLEEHKRERLQIAMSLRALCVRNLGSELTPSNEDILSISLLGGRK